jgi:uncharacterized protein YkwD
VRPREIVTLGVTAAALLGALALPRVEASFVGDADGCPRSGDLPKSDGLDSTRAAILCLLNDERAQHGLAPLTTSALLELASQRHSEDMGLRKFFAHETPDGADPGRRMEAVGYPVTSTTTGENLAWGTGPEATPVRIVKGWMNSPGHRENILRPEFTQVGVGVAYEAPIASATGPVGVYTTDFGGLGPSS